MQTFVNFEMMDRRFRLLNNNMIREFHNDENDDDFVAELKGQLKKLVLPKQLEINGSKYEVDSDSFSFSEIDSKLNTHYYTFIEPGDPIVIPSIEQLKNCIKYGNDKIGNRLVLTVYGFFALENNAIDITEAYSVLSYEYSVPGNGYIGEKASADEGYIKSLFVTGLKHYLIFLKTGKTASFSDVFDSPKEIEANIAEIKKILSRLLEEKEE